MKIPKIHLNYHYAVPEPLTIRFGRGRDGVYFFAVVSKSAAGIGFIFCSRLYGGDEWKRYCLYLTDLDRKQRMKLIRRVIRVMRRQITKSGAIFAGVEKFTVKRLFHPYIYQIKATSPKPDTT